MIHDHLPRSATTKEPFTTPLCRLNTTRGLNIRDDRDTGAECGPVVHFTQFGNGRGLCCSPPDSMHRAERKKIANEFLLLEKDPCAPLKVPQYLNANRREQPHAEVLKELLPRYFTLRIPPSLFSSSSSLLSS